MAKIYSRKKILYAAKETTYGTAATITGAAAIQTSNLTIQPLQGDALELNLDKSTFGSDLGSLVGKHVMVTFRVPVAGSGAAGTAPAWGTLLLGCGHTETVNAGTDVTYTPLDDNPDSLTLRVEFDKVLHSITGARGSVKLVTDKRNYAWFEFSFMGLYNAPVANSTPLTPVWTPWKKPVPFRASTVSCTLIGQVVGLHQMNLDFGQKVEFYEHSEEESIQITDRKARFDAQFEETEIGTHNYFADINTDTAGALDYTHGITGGNIVQITATNTQITSVQRQDVQGVSAFQVSGPLAAISPNPDYSIVAK